jgi:hypothetical protein
MAISGKAKIGLGVGVITMVMVVVVIIIAVSIIYLRRRKRTEQSKNVPPTAPVGPQPSDVSDGNTNTASAPPPAQSNKAMSSSLPTGCKGMDLDIADSWKSTNVSVTPFNLGNQAIGKYIDKSFRVKHDCNPYFEQSTLGPMYLVAKKKLLAVTVTVSMKVFFHTYNINQKFSDRNLKIGVIKLAGGVDSTDNITVSTLFDVLSAPLETPPFSRIEDVDVEFKVLDNINTSGDSSKGGVPIQFEKDDVMALVFDTAGIQYTLGAGSISVSAFS